MEYLLRLRLLGGFSLELDGAPVSTIDTPRLRGLLGYLALQYPHQIPRRTVAFALWPDASEAQAHASLRALIHRLRAALPALDEILMFERQTFAWRHEPTCWIDVIEFNAAWALRSNTSTPDISALQRAVELYRGDLLPELYDEWAIHAREQLQARFAALLTALMQQYEQARNYPSAIAAAQRLVQLEPLQEAAYRDLMRLHTLNQDRAGAIQVYHSCAALFERELGVAPSETTHDLYETLLHYGKQPPLVTERTPSAPTLVGRHNAWNTLFTVWRDLAEGATMVVISGEAGVGKTRLAEELRSWVERQGRVVARAACFAAEELLAYEPVSAWLASDSIRPGLAALDNGRLRELGRLVPDLLAVRTGLTAPGPLTEEWQRQRLFDAVATALLQRQPLLLMLDDLQWCDIQSMDFLRYLLPRAADTPLMLLMTAREEEMLPEHPAHRLLRDLGHKHRLVQLHLAPLDAGDSAALAAQLLKRPLSDAEIGQLYAETEGNPLFVVERVRAGLQTHVHGAMETTAPGAAALPPRVQHLMEARLAQLSSPARNLAALVAVSGRACSVGLLRLMSGDERELVLALDELWRRRVLREISDHSYDFTHARLREVMYEGLSLPRRRWLHGRVAEALERQPEQLGHAAHSATHFAEAGEPLRAAQAYQQAATAATAIYAHEAAIGYLERALALLDADSVTDALPAALWEALGDARRRIGALEPALEAYHRAQDRYKTTDTLPRARLVRKLGEHAALRHSFDAAIDQYKAALRLLGEPPEDFEEEQAWWQEWLDNRVGLLWAYYQTNEAADLAGLEEAVRVTVAIHGSPRQRYQVLHVLKSIRQRQERMQLSVHTVALAEEVLAAAAASGDEESLAHATFGFGFTCLWHGEPRRALEHIAGALDHNRRVGDRRLEVQCLTYATIAHRRLDDVVMTKEYAARALAAAMAVQLPLYVGVAAANQAWLAWRTGDIPKVKALARASVERLTQDGVTFPFLWLASFPFAAALLADGRAEEACEELWRLFSPHQQPLPAELADALTAALHAAETRAQDAPALLSGALALANKLALL